MWNIRKYAAIAAVGTGLAFAAASPASAQCGGWGGGYGAAGWGGHPVVFVPMSSLGGYGGWGGGYGGFGGGYGGFGGGYGGFGGGYGGYGGGYGSGYGVGWSGWGGGYSGWDGYPVMFVPWSSLGGYGGGYGGFGGGYGGFGGGYGGCRAHHHPHGHGGYSLAYLPRHHQSGYAYAAYTPRYNRVAYAGSRHHRQLFAAAAWPAL